MGWGRQQGRAAGAGLLGDRPGGARCLDPFVHFAQCSDCAHQTPHSRSRQAQQGQQRHGRSHKPLRNSCARCFALLLHPGRLVSNLHACCAAQRLKHLAAHAWQARHRRSRAACTAAAASMRAPASSTARALCRRKWGFAAALRPAPPLPDPCSAPRRLCTPLRPAADKATPAAAAPAARCGRRPPPCFRQCLLGLLWVAPLLHAGPHAIHPVCLPQKNFENKSQTLRAVTIKQLADASAQRVDDSLVIDGRDVSNVSCSMERRLHGGVKYVLCLGGMPCRSPCWRWGGLAAAMYPSVALRSDAAACTCKQVCRWHVLPLPGCASSRWADGMPCVSFPS